MIHKWIHYFDIYERLFEKFIGKEINILEIGVSHGGSLQMWKDYFGDKATKFGLDIDPLCKSFEEEKINIIIGDQGDGGFWKTIKPTLPKFDIIIDDGVHHMSQLKTTFQEMFPELSSHGVYFIEDLHTCYWEEYGGGLGKPDNFIEYSKK